MRSFATFALAEALTVTIGCGVGASVTICGAGGATTTGCAAVLHAMTSAIANATEAEIERRIEDLLSGAASSRRNPFRQRKYRITIRP
jgi:hypothetical protein